VIGTAAVPGRAPPYAALKDRSPFLVEPLALNGKLIPLGCGLSPGGVGLQCSGAFKTFSPTWRCALRNQRCAELRAPTEG
jgi:hypothetical protein